MPQNKQTKRKRSPSPTSSSSSSSSYAGLDVNNLALGNDLDYNYYKEQVENLATTTLDIAEFGEEIKRLKKLLYQILQKYSENLEKKEVRKKVQLLKMMIFP